MWNRTLRPAPSARALTLLVAAAVGGLLLLVAGAVIGILAWALASGSGWLKRHVAASERTDD